MHTLTEDDTETATPSMDLIPTTEFIKNLDVVFEEVVAPAAISENDFIITPVSKEDIEAIEVTDAIHVQEEQEEQIALSFDMPIEKEATPIAEEEAPIVFDLTDDINEIEVKDAIEIVPVTEANEDGVVKYSLEHYMDMEEQLTNAEATETKQETVVEEDEALVFERKIATEETPAEEAIETEVNPLNSSIEDILKSRADERRRKMKEFNYKFRNNAGKIDEIEKEPAYKRMGIDLDETQPSSEDSSSRMSLGVDSNDDIQLRSNNSFLHDNVD